MGTELLLQRWAWEPWGQLTAEWAGILREAYVSVLPTRQGVLENN